MYDRALTDDELAILKRFSPRPVQRPIPVPGIFDGAAYCFDVVNAAWLPHVIGALWTLDQPDAWSGTDEEIENARNEIRRLIASLLLCVDPPPPESDYADIVTALSPLAWWKLNEASGTTVTNYGSGTGLDATNSGSTIAEDGAIGTDEAYRFDGLDSVVYVNYTNVTPITSLTTWTWCFLFYAESRGESNQGSFFRMEQGSNLHRLHFNSTNGIQGYVQGVGSSADFRTNSNPINAWTWLFFTYDHAGEKKPRAWLGNAGVVAEAGYDSSPGTLSVDVATTEYRLNIGRRYGGANTFDGLMDEVILFPSLLTIEQMTDIVVASGV